MIIRPCICLLNCVLLLQSIVFIATSEVEEVPPKECYDHNELLDGTRLFDNRGTPTSTGNDINLKLGWYRVLGAAGNGLKQGFEKVLKTGNSAPNFCGTKYAGTLMGEHPTKEEGLVQMTVCFRARYCFFNNIDKCKCQEKNIIYVRNCGKHFVYWLFPTSANMRYCTGRTGLAGAAIVDYKSTAVECSQHWLLKGSSRKWNDVSDVNCDEEDGWYRFSEEAGTEISSKCTKTNQTDITRFGQPCGAQFRGWMVNKHPRLNEGRVKRKVCFSYSDRCSCEFYTNIHVRNCGDFYVYRFNKVPLCSARYCGAAPSSLSIVNDESKPVVEKDEDFCSMYKTLYDPDRLWSFTNPTVTKCDANLYGKYRFGSKYTPWTIHEGCSASELAIVTHRCGAQYQGYMIGKHPNRKGEKVQRIICFQSPKVACECQHTSVITVQNCGDYFVYDLQGITECSSRYCMVANKSSKITINPDKPPLYELPSAGYNPIFMKQVEEVDDDGHETTTAVLAIIVFIVLVLLILLILLVLYMMWPMYKKRRDFHLDDEFSVNETEMKASNSNGKLPRDQQKEEMPSSAAVVPPFPDEPPPKPPSEGDSEIEMQRGPGSEDDLHTIPEDGEFDDEYDTLVKKEDVNKPKPYEAVV